MEHLKQETVSGAQLNMDALYQICPQCFTECKDAKTGETKHAVDFEKLRLLLGDIIAEGDERYDFTWVGKRAALQEAAKPIRKTLRPCPEESVDWENTKNLYIEGDNLEVLKLLQNSYMGKVKMIYIDPPYNTGNDFIYEDNYKQDRSDYDLFAGNVDKEGYRYRKNSDTGGEFHSKWCSNIYSRLLIARSFLTEDGLIFISLDDKEICNLIKICNEVFGEYNFVGNIIWQSRTSISNDDEISTNHNHTLVYSKNRELLTFGGDDIDINDYVNPDNDPRGPWKLVPIDANHVGGDTVYPIRNPHNGIDYYPPNGRIWCYNKKTLQDLMDDGRIKFGLNDDSSPKRKLYYNERIEKGDCKTPSSILLDAGTTKSGTTEIMDLFDGKKVFDYPKPSTLVERLIKYGFVKKDDVVLDFYSGSATTAHSVFSYNADPNRHCRFILVQFPEDLDKTLETASNDAKKTIKVAIDFLDGINKPHLITEIGKERIRRVGKKILEEQKAKQGDLFSGDQKPLDVGFRVFKCADSNMKDVYYTPADYDQQMLFDLENNVKEDRNDLDLLFGCMLDWGVTLDLPLRSEKVDGVTIHIVNEGDLVACFDQNIPESAIDHIASLLPMRVVLRDSCFKEAKEKMNFFEIFKQRTGWSEEEVRKNVKVI